MEKRLTADVHIGRIAELYGSGLSTITIGKQLNLTEWGVRRALHRAGIKLRTRFAFSRKHKINESYFEKIDTEAKAYWLGFLYADGAVYSSRKGYMFHLTLADKDSEHVEMFKEALQTEIPIHLFLKKKKRGLFVWSKRIYSDLVRAGCHERKGFKIRLPQPDVVPTILLRHFIRGYFDGDGNISWQPKKSRIVVKIVTNVDMAAELRDFFTTELGITPMYKTKVMACKHKPEDLYTTVEFGRYENMQKYYDFLYRDSTILLQRKKDIFDTYFTHKKNKA